MQRKKETKYDTLQSSVELVDSGSDREIDGLVSKVDNQSPEDGLVDLVLDDESFALTGEGGLLEGVLESLLEVLLEGLGGGDGDLDLASVGGHNLEEVVDDLFGVVESTVVGEHFEEGLGHFGDGGLGVGGLEELVDTGGTILGGENGVGEEVLDLGLGLDGGSDADEIAFDLLERCGANAELRKMSFRVRWGRKREGITISWRRR